MIAMQTSEGPFLATDNLCLRPLKMSDAARMTALLQTPEISAMTATIPHPYHLENAEQFISERIHPGTSGPAGPLAVESENELIGIVDLSAGTRNCDDEIPVLGFWVGRPSWGRGVATEAVGAMIHVHFARRGVERIRSQVLETNGASLKIHRKLGFRHAETIAGKAGRPAARHFTLDPDDFGFDPGWHGLRYLWRG
ncbi:MAG: GNAT family N-acetyltransferase [Alphaproteobacteria bacterium]|nr:GNAT family N-acetyltransferase [Alphaproteobacteria bacterium]